MTFFEKEQLRFRSHELGDEADFVRMPMDPEVRRYGGGQGWPLEKAQHRFRKEYLGQPTKIYGLWATILKGEEKYIGSCGLARAGMRERLILATTWPVRTGGEVWPQKHQGPSSISRLTALACVVSWRTWKKG